MIKKSQRITRMGTNEFLEGGMGYRPIEVDRQRLTIMGVEFSDLATLISAANAIGSNMFEGFEPTPRLIEIYRDYRAGKISGSGLVDLLRGAM